MKELEKGQLGYLYDANNDPEIKFMHQNCLILCHKLNQLSPFQQAQRNVLIKQILGDIGEGFDILSPFYCDFGKNIHIGTHFYANHNVSILDGGRVDIGDYVFIAPNVVISTAGHAIDQVQRDQGLEIALPIKIGSHVWLGANVSIVPGVSIGNNVVIGAGAVVTKDIPDNVIAAGNPCKVIRKITEEDKNKYPILDE